MTIKQADPLPECLGPGCEQPTRRDVWEKNGGLCTRCSTTLADTVRMLPVRDTDVAQLDDARRRRLERLALNDQTVFVERYLPPVPGQLELPESDS